jgi:hypothetical protein
MEVEGREPIREKKNVKRMWTNREKSYIRPLLPSLVISALKMETEFFF